MHKPHEYPLRIRLWNFLRGLFLYNTVYWKRASDELKPPRLSREERALLQPSLDLDIVRPRTRPRVNPVVDPVADPSLPVVPVPPVDVQTPPAELASLVLPEEVSAGPSPVLAPETSALPLPSEVDGQQTVVKRRRYRRRRNKVRGSRSTTGLAANQEGGILDRLLKMVLPD